MDQQWCHRNVVLSTCDHYPLQLFLGRRAPNRVPSVMKITDLKSGLRLRNLLAGSDVVLIAAEAHGKGIANVVYRSDDGTIADRLVTDSDLEGVVEVTGSRWTFDADGAAFRLASEARRIELAHVFDPFAVVADHVVTRETNEQWSDSARSPRSGKPVSTAVHVHDSWMQIRSNALIPAWRCGAVRSGGVRYLQAQVFNCSLQHRTGLALQCTTHQCVVEVSGPDQGFVGVPQT